MPGSKVSFVRDAETVRLVPGEAEAPQGRGAVVVAQLQCTAALRLTTDEIMALTRDTP